jgi:hypothetical protein
MKKLMQPYVWCGSIFDQVQRWGLPIGPFRLALRADIPPAPVYEYTPIPHLVRWGRAHGAGDPIRQRDSLGRQENIRLSKFDQS